MFKSVVKSVVFINRSDSFRKITKTIWRSESHRNMDNNNSSTQFRDKHQQSGALGVDINSYQPPAESTATLPLNDVKNNPLPVLPDQPDRIITDNAPPKKSELVYDPEAQTFVPQPVRGESGNPSGQKREGERVFDQFMQKASEVLGEVKDRAGVVLEEAKDRAGVALGDIKEKAGDVWQTVAGAVGAAPGKELKDDHTEVIVAGEQRNATTSDFSQRGSSLGVDINSYQPPVDAPAGMYLHGEVRTAAGDGKRPTEVVNEETAKSHSN